MKQNNYKHLINYFVENEYEDTNNDTYNFLPSLRNDERNNDLLQHIVDSFNDEELLHDLDTGIVRDMFEYFLKHKEGFKPEPFEYI